MTIVPSGDIVLTATDVSRRPHYRARVGAAIVPADNATARTPWITPREAAVYLGVHVETIYDACAAGGLKHSRLGRRTIRLKREWLDAWVNEHVRQPK